MGLKRTHWMLVAAVGGLAAVLALLGARLAGPALGQATTVRVDSPGTASVGGSATVRIKIDSVTNLATYEWVLAYDPSVLQLDSVTDGPFLGSTGRTPTCVLLLPPGIDSDGDTIVQPPLDIVVPEGTARFGCVSTGGATLSGSGDLSTVTFTGKAPGSTSLCLSWAVLGDPDANDIPTGVVNGSIAVGGGSPAQPSCAAAATPVPPATPTPPSDETPGPPVATATPGPPAATATPQGPTPTPAPTPPPESAEVMDLIAGCNPTTTTYPDGTTVQTLTAATAPAGTLDAIWKFDAGVWRAYSPEFPQASDLAVTAFLDVVFLCVDAPATFVRPLV
jgi:hypothetical protein